MSSLLRMPRGRRSSESAGAWIGVLSSAPVQWQIQDALERCLVVTVRWRCSHSGHWSVKGRGEIMHERDDRLVGVQYAASLERTM